MDTPDGDSPTLLGVLHLVRQRLGPARLAAVAMTGTMEQRTAVTDLVIAAEMAVEQFEEAWKTLGNEVVEAA